MFLVIANSEALPLGWEVHAEFKFFVFDQNLDNFLMIQDAGGRARRFHRMKTEWGIARLLPHSEFRDASNGYLVRDKCAFGVEIFVISRPNKGERLTLATTPDIVAYTWKIDKFSSLEENTHNSPIFTLANFEWQLDLYPKGDSRADGKSLSLFLSIKDSEAPARVYAEYTLTIRNQFNNKNDENRRCNVWFTASAEGWGLSNFMSLNDIRDASKGFLVNDTLIVEVRIESISTLQNFSEESSTQSFMQKIEKSN